MNKRTTSKKTKIEIVKDPELGYYAIRAKGSTVGIFNFSNFCEQVTEIGAKKRAKNKKEIEAFFYDMTVRVKITVEFDNELK